MAIKFGDVFNTSDLNINNPKLEEMLNKTKNAAEVFGKKSAERIEISKKKIELFDIKSKLNKLYEDFGRYQYNAFVNGSADESEISARIDEITDLEKKCEELNIDIEYTKTEFYESVMNMAQKTKEAFKNEFSSASQENVDVSEFFDSEDEDDTEE